MLTNSKTLSSFSVNNLNAAKDFYNKLGLKEVQAVDGVLRFEAGNGTEFLIYEKQDHVPATYTTMYFLTDNIESEVSELSASGIKMEIYEGAGQSENGIAATPDGGKIAWFKDPAGNILALMQEK